MFDIGDRVRRIEDKSITGAVIIAVDCDYYEIVYDEGGSGWWPETALIRETIL